MVLNSLSLDQYHFANIVPLFQREARSAFSTAEESMPPRRSKAKPSGDSAAAAVIVDQAPVRRSARTRRAVAQEDYESEKDEPPRKRGRSETSERSSPASINVEEGNSTEPLEVCFHMCW